MDGTADCFQLFFIIPLFNVRDNGDAGQDRLSQLAQDADFQMEKRRQIHLFFKTLPELPHHRIGDIWFCVYPDINLMAETDADFFHLEPVIRRICIVFNRQSFF